MCSASRTSVVILAVVLAAVTGWGQEPGYRVESNPLQEEFPYQVPNELRPMVEVEGVRLSLVRILPKEGAEISAGKPIQFTLVVELDNTGAVERKVMVVVLLEDVVGKQLENLKLPTLKLKAGTSTSSTQKYKVDGKILRDTTKLWIFLEVL